MALKAIITAEDFAKLPDAIKAEYKAAGDGYHLDVSGASELPEIKRAKDNENTRRKAAEARADAAEAKAAELEEAGGDAQKQVAAAVKPLQKQVDTLTQANAALKGFVEKDLITDKAMALATSISTAPKLMLPHVRDRLSVAYDDEGRPEIVVKGADGNPLPGGLDKLKTELVADKDFANIVIASKASGGGGAPNSPPSSGGGAAKQSPNNSGDGTTPNLASLKPSEMAARIAARKAESPPAA